MISLLVQAGIAVSFLLLDAAYHRWIQDKPVEKKLPQESAIPRSDEGAPIAMFFGRVRVRQPIIAWTGASAFDEIDDDKWRMNMILVIGIPMADGFGETGVHKIWAGDLGFDIVANDGSPPLKEILCRADDSPGETIGPFCTFYDGNNSQDPAAAELGEMQTNEGVPASEVAGYIGRLTICLGKAGGGLTRHWAIGDSSRIPAYSFEVSSYASSNVYPARGSQAVIGQDMNPVNILWDLLIRKLGKLGIPSDYLDMDSFQAAGQILVSETFGLSAVFEQTMSANQMIQEVLRHIDGAIDEDPSTGKLVLTLVRPVDPATLPHITRDNCDKLQNFVASGWTGLQSSLRLTWTNRSKDYNDDTVIIPSQGNAVNQAETEELEVDMRMIHELALAIKVADREAQAQIRPIMKCSVLVGREFKNIRRGEAVKLTWKNPDISAVVFRVADIDRGTIDDGKVRLDLISDYFYSARGQTQEPLIDRLNDHLDDIGDFSFT